MRISSAILALACFALLAGCAAMQIKGRPIDRSLSGQMTKADTAPHGAAFLVVAVSLERAANPLDYFQRHYFARFDIRREAADFQISQGAGFLAVPPNQLADSRSLYVIPGRRESFVLEYSQGAADDSRLTMATLADRRCIDSTCVLAIAGELPIGEEAGKMHLPRAAGCEGEDCPLDAQAFAQAAPQLLSRTDSEQFKRFFLLYQDAQPR